MGKIILRGGPALSSIKVKNNTSGYKIESVTDIQVWPVNDRLQLTLSVIESGRPMTLRGPIDVDGMELRIDE